MRPQISGHFGKLPWGTLSTPEQFADGVSAALEEQKHTIARFGADAMKAATPSRSGYVKSLVLRITATTHHRFQWFADGVRQTVSTAGTRLGAFGTSERFDDAEERREASRREYHSGLAAPAEVRAVARLALDSCAHEAMELLDADYAPANIAYDYLAIDADILGLILHEALGHAAEGDLIETGSSGFGEDGRFRAGLEVAPPWMNIVIDGNLDNCGYSPLDYEGVPSRRKTIVREGRLVEAIHMRQTALSLGHVPEGSARAETAADTAQCRMTSIWIQARETNPLQLPDARVPQGPYPPELLREALARDGYLSPGRRVLYLVGWKGGTASCSNLEFRADVRRLYALTHDGPPRLLRSANFTGIATACFQSAVAAYGAHLCRTLGTCGKDGQGVLTSDGGPMILVLGRHPQVSIIGTGEANE